MYAKCEHCSERAVKVIEYQDAFRVSVTEMVCDGHAENQSEVRQDFKSKGIHEVEIDF